MIQLTESMEASMLQIMSEAAHKLFHQKQVERQLVSLAKAAKILGISRNSTLPSLIASGRIRTVQIRGRKRISLTELDRFMAEDDAYQRKSKAGAKKNKTLGEEILSIKI